MVIFILVVVIILIGVILKYRQKREESHKKLEAQYHFHEKGQPWNTLSTLQDTNWLYTTFFVQPVVLFITINYIYNNRLSFLLLKYKIRINYPLMY